MFDADQRVIFHFFDGTKERYVDPLVIMCDLKDELRDENIEVLLGDLNSGNEDRSLVSFLKLVKAAGKVFGITPLTSDGVGLTTLESLKVLVDFVQQQDVIKKNIEMSLSGLASTESPQEPSSPTSGGMGSGSTAAAPNPQPQPQSPRVSAMP